MDNTEDKVVSIVQDIIKSHENTVDNPDISQNQKLSKSSESSSIKGLPKSGRFWKSNKER